MKQMFNNPNLNGSAPLSVQTRLASGHRYLTAVLMLVICSSASLAVPLGGAGSMTRQSIRGSLEVQGTLSVDGRTVLNGKEYVWPRTKDATKPGSVLKNSGNGNLIWAKEVSPSGDDGALQISESGSFSSDMNLTWNKKEKNLYIGSSPVSLSGHTHAMTDLKGILTIESGGTGTDNGSINAVGELVLSAGGENKNVVLNPSGTGFSVLNGSGTVSKGTVRSEAGFNVRGIDGASGSYDVVSGVKIENNSLKKKIRQFTVSGGIITAIGEESDWMDAGSVIFPAAQAQPVQE